METKGMKRSVMTLAIVGLVVAGVGLVPESAWASGGGGCGRRVSDGHGTTITIKAFCFGPTVLRVHKGHAVTFVNRDPFAHTVLGANGVWGSFDQLKTGASVTYRFVRAGVYPYVCTFHPGMVGVVVVGSANGPGAAHATITKAGPVKLVQPRTAAPDPVPAVGAPAPAAEPVAARAPIAAWAISALLVAFAAAVAATLRSRRRIHVVAR